MKTCKHCGHVREDHDFVDGDHWICGGADGQCECFQFTRVSQAPIRGARLNGSYCLVRLTYLQAQQLYRAATEPADALSDMGGREFRALREALGKLQETSERWA
jgi:hypothetical protein